MSGAGIPDGQALAPLECPISTTVLQECTPFLRVVFAMINEARLSGSLTLLLRTEAAIQSALDEGAERPPDKRIDTVKALTAAHGECLSIRGRWQGDGPDRNGQITEGHGEKLLKQGAKEIKEFVDWVESRPKILEGNVATAIRAHAFYGNALARLAYHTRQHTDLRQAFFELEKQRALLKKLRVNNAIPAAMYASWSRDAGDVHVGMLHWSKGTDTLDDGACVEIDGAGIAHLRAASDEFIKLYRVTGEPAMLDEWAACESSLAVAQARTALLLRDDLKHNTGGLEPTRKFLAAEKKGMTREERSAGLVGDAEATAFRVWRVYLGLLNQPRPVSWRWVRSISNIAHALSYVVMVEGVDRRLAAAALSEVAFRSVLDLGLKEEERLMVPTEFDGMWYGALLGIGPGAPGEASTPAHYGDDHPHRYHINDAGLRALIDLVMPERNAS